MKDIMIDIFREYNFIKTWEGSDKIFFVNTDKKIVSYFILNFIDCTNISDDEGLIRKELSKLEEEYVDSGQGIKYSIISSFKNKQEVSQIDKNTSAIYVVKFSEMNMLSKYRNLIYSIEESPNYFKRYILPYTANQVNGLKDVLINYKNKNIVEILSQLADEEENYYSLMNGTNDNSVYELVIRLFSKIPFLQCQFKATSDDISLEKIVEDSLDNDLVEYDKAIKENRIVLEELISLEKDDITEERIDKIINQLVEEVE